MQAQFESLNLNTTNSNPNTWIQISYSVEEKSDEIKLGITGMSAWLSYISSVDILQNFVNYVYLWNVIFRILIRKMIHH